MGRKEVEKLEKIVAVKIWIKSKNKSKAEIAAKKIEAKYRK